MIGWLAAVPAQAVDREVCIQVDHEFDDATYTPAVRFDLDDYLNDDAVPEPYRGALIWVTGSGYFQVGYADDATGCRTFTGLTAGSSYTIKVWSQALVEGHTIELLDDDTTPLEYSITFPWTVGGPFVTTKTIATGDRQWNVMTAATFAIHRRDGGLPPQTFTLYNTICSSGGSCYSASADAMYTDSNKKFVVVHETTKVVGDVLDMNTIFNSYAAVTLRWGKPGKATKACTDTESTSTSGCWPTGSVSVSQGSGTYNVTLTKTGLYPEDYAVLIECRNAADQVIGPTSPWTRTSNQ